MRCAHCGHETPADSAFCTRCGSPLASRPPTRSRSLTVRQAQLAVIIVLALVLVLFAVLHCESPRTTEAPWVAEPLGPPAPGGQPRESSTSESQAHAEAHPLASPLLSAESYAVHRPAGWQLVGTTSARNRRGFTAKRRPSGDDTLVLTVVVHELPPGTTLADFSWECLDAALSAGARPVEDSSDFTLKHRPARRVVVKVQKGEAAICFFLHESVGFEVSMEAPTGRLAAHQSEFDKALDAVELLDDPWVLDGETLAAQTFGTDTYTVLKPAGWRYDRGAEAKAGAQPLKSLGGALAGIPLRVVDNRRRQFWAFKALPDGGALRLYIGAADLCSDYALAAFTDERLDSIHGMRREADATNLTLAGEPARRVLLKSGQRDLGWYFLEHRGTGYEVSLEAPPNSLAAHQRDFDRILGTFRFLEGRSTTAPNGAASKVTSAATPH